MPGCERAATALASVSKRRRISGSEATCSAMTLIATSRSSLRSRARYTSPIPPDPSGDRTSYCARRCPFVSDIGLEGWPVFYRAGAAAIDHSRMITTGFKTVSGAGLPANSPTSSSCRTALVTRDGPCGATWAARSRSPAIGFEIRFLLSSISGHPARDIQHVGKARAHQHAGREHGPISAFADCRDRGVLVELVTPRDHVVDGNVNCTGDMPGVPFAFRAHVDERQRSTAFESFAKLSG